MGTVYTEALCVFSGGTFLKKVSHHTPSKDF